MFGSRKIFSGNAIFGKGKYFQVFGCIPKTILAKMQNASSKAVFGSHKIFSGNSIFGKGKYFQVFGCILKNILENIF